jgi:hypothetical protein
MIAIAMTQPLTIARIGPRVVLALLTSIVIAACAREDPARTALRERLKQTTPLSNEELGRVRDEVGRAIADKHVRIKEGGATHEFDERQRYVVLGMLTEPAGMFDEGLRQEAGTTVRVLNSPGESDNAEIEASRRMWVDIETFLPVRFEFTYAFPGNGDYAYDLAVER